MSGVGCVAALICVAFASAPGHVSAGPQEKSKQESGRFKLYKIPAGTAVSVELRTTIDSAISELDDQVDAALREPIAQDGAELLPAGSRIHGSVVEVRAASEQEPRGRLAIAFHVIEHARTRDRASITTKVIVAEAPIELGPDGRASTEKPADVKMARGQVHTMVLARALFVKIPR